MKLFHWFRKYRTLRKSFRNAEKARLAAEKLLMERTSDFAKTNKLYREIVAREGEKLERAERTLESLVNAVTDVIFRADIRGYFTYVNDQAQEFLGYPREELLQMHFTELLDADIADYVKDYYRKQLEEGEEMSYLEFKARKKNGELIWLGQKVRIVYQDGEPLELNAVARDITEDKKNAEKLDVLYKRMETLISSLNSAVLVEDENRNIVLVNQEFCDLFNIPVPPEQLIGTDCSKSAEMSKQLFTDPEGFVNRIDEILLNRVQTKPEKLMLVSSRVLEREYVPVFLEEKYRGHLWQYRDITESELFNQKLKMSEEKYRGIIENMELGLLEVDNQQQITRAYPGFCKMMGYDDGELEGTNSVKLFYSDNALKVIEENKEKRLRGDSGVFEIEMIKKNGDRIWVMISGAPLFDDRGNINGSIGIYYDITHMKELQKELIEARNIAEKSQEAEKEFLAHTSHEIRNPINAIFGASSLLLDTKLSKQQQDHLETIKFSSELLLSLIRDVLDINRIDSGEMPFKEEAVKLGDLINSVVKIYKFKVEGKKLELKAIIPDELDFYVYTDKTYIQQILMNLVGNALKFTSKGSISVELRPVKVEAQSVLIQLVVSDTGIGIAPDKLQDVFTRFRQADHGILQKYGGTGLGLSITRQLVEAMGGDISVESEVNQGTSFITTLNFRRAKAKKEALSNDDINVIVDGIQQVLIVEDNIMNQKYLAGVLKKQGITIDIANNGVEALELVKQHEYDLIFMDIRMPKMDGYTATRHIRKMEGNPNCNKPIIALTASAMVDEKEKVLAVGMNDHLSKPYTTADLFKLINLNKKNQPHEDANDGLFKFDSRLDTEILDDLYGSDIGYAYKMFEVFLEIYNNELSLLENSQQNKDWKLFFNTVHKMKSNFSMVGLSDISLLFEELESYRDEKIFDENEVNSLFYIFLEKQSGLIPVVKKQLDQMALNTNELAE